MCINRPRTRRRQSAPEIPSPLREAPPPPSALSRLFRPTLPTLSPATRSDHVLRNLAALSIVAAFALTFLHIFLYTAIFAVGMLAPAWQTFKALERRNNPPVEVIHLDDGDHDHCLGDNDDDNDDNDDADEDWLPPRERARRSTRSTATATAATSANVADVHRKVEAERMLQNWQAYWVMAALLFAVDGLLSPLLCHMLPKSVYAAGLFSAVAWLTRNHGANAAVVYAAVVRPLFLKSEATVDHLVEKLMAEADVVSQEAVVKVNRIVEPYARQLEHAAETANREMRQAADGRFRHRRLRTFLR